VTSVAAPGGDTALIRARLDALRRRADMPPATPRDALALEPTGAGIGSLERDVAERLATAGLVRPSAGGWRVNAPADESLARIAHWLDGAGLGGRWRNELLDVIDPSHGRVAVIERAAVRPLGIKTYAVHLLGVRADGKVWVQQRALDKATDPGQWDTTMGGQVGAGESSAETLDRETWEEAGLRSAQLQRLERVDRLEMRRPVQEGYLIEQIDVFEAVVPSAMEPRNQDGEVHTFECLTAVELRERLDAGLFTLEAALILWGWLYQRAAVAR
jgi:isopentenyldiphosphate isomerase